MGRRELVALAALVLAIVVTAGFFVVNAGQGSNLPRITPTPAAQGTQGTLPTPQDVVPPPSGLPTSILLPPSGPWQVQFISNDPATLGTVAAQGPLPTLDIAFDAAPSQALKDNAWGIDATATFVLAAGRYAFVIEHTGTVDVFVDNLEMARQGANPAGQSLRVEFQSNGGVNIIRIVANDTGGPFRLQLVTPTP